jgi:hypothetical protein
MAALDTFRDAQRRAMFRHIDSITMAGTHLTSAHGYGDSHLGRMHRELADVHASAALLWREAQADYGVAERAIQQRLDDAALEARELELAARFHHVLDLVPVAA